MQLGKHQVTGSFGSKLTFTVGTAYMGFGALGFIVGALTTKKPKFVLPSLRLTVSYYMKNMWQTAISWANNSGGAEVLLSNGLVWDSKTESEWTPSRDSCRIGGEEWMKSSSGSMESKSNEP